MNIIKDPKFTQVAMACSPEEPNDKEIEMMIDDAVRQIYGPDGFRAMVKPGDRVVIHTNIVCCWQGARGEKGRGVITDPRICRYVAEQIRDIIGPDKEGGSSLKVVDATFEPGENPSNFNNKVSFHYARLNRVPDNTVSEEDITYDYNGDGYLDGRSHAKLVNLDSIDADGRVLKIVELVNGRKIKVAFPKFLLHKDEVEEGEDYTDVYIGLPIFKNHCFVGCTGSLKLHYGLRDLRSHFGDTGRRGHSGMFSYAQDGTITKQGQDRFHDYVTALHKIRPHDFVLMDCLTANRKGPCSEHGAVSITPDPDEKVDYILSNAILASKDSVAIDAVETCLGGYQTDSIGLITKAAENGVGVCDPAKIEVIGLEKFKIHRARLLREYGSQGRYPLAVQGGGSNIVNILPEYQVHLNHFTLKPDEKGMHHIKYTIVQTVDRAHKPDIRRVDLVCLGRVIMSVTGEDIDFNGEFTFAYEDCGVLPDTYAVGYIAVWDNIYNCVLSREEFFIPPTGCTDLDD